MTDEPRFARVPRTPSLADQVAEQILETIISEGLKPGDALPSERELGTQFDVSRTVVREAVRSLSGKGVIEVTPGRGLAVANIDSSAVSASFRLLMRLGGGLAPDLIHEVRAMIETEVAGLAAERATEPEVALLLEAHEYMIALEPGDIEALSEADLEFHRVLAGLTHNPLHLIMLDSIRDLLLEIRLATMTAGADAERTEAQHRRIADAVKAHDVDGARRAMEQHLDTSADELALVARA